MTGTSDPIDAFETAMAQQGLVVKDALVADGVLHRFHVDGDSNGSRNGYYKLHLDGIPAGAYGCWKRGIKETWKAEGAPTRDAHPTRDIAAERERSEQKRAKRQKSAAEDAATQWDFCKLAPQDHPYLARKGVQPNGARIDGQNRLVLAIADTDGEVWSLQTIDAAGAKLFMSGGRKQGCLFAIGEPADRIVIAEGFATGASIHKATGLCVAVAFDAGNLEPVARAIREGRPTARIVIAADDDCETDGNPGLTAARKAADAVRGHVAIPTRQPPNGKKLDFNDLHAAEGSETVAAIIMSAFAGEGERTPSRKSRSTAAGRNDLPLPSRS